MPGGLQQIDDDFGWSEKPEEEDRPITWKDAIPTRLRGITYRSRLEARWAVFFHGMGQQFVYEPGKYDLGGGLRYMPDFFFPSLDRHGCFVEIKPKEPTEVERQKAGRLAVVTSQPVYVFCGVPDVGTQEHIGGALQLIDQTRHERGYFWSQCPQCNLVGITRAGLADTLSCSCFHLGDWRHAARQPQLMICYMAARQAKFGDVFGAQPTEVEG